MVPTEAQASSRPRRAPFPRPLCTVAWLRSVRVEILSCTAKLSLVCATLGNASKRAPAQQESQKVGLQIRTARGLSEPGVASE